MKIQIADAGLVMKSLALSLAFAALPLCLHAQNDAAVQVQISRAVLDAYINPAAHQDIQGAPRIPTKRPGASTVTTRFGFDPRTVSSKLGRGLQRTGEIEWGADRSSSFTAAIVAGRGNIDVVRSDHALRSCEVYDVGARGPTDKGHQVCKFQAFQTLLALGEPQITGDTAKVELFDWTNPPPASTGYRQRGGSSSTTIFTLIKRQSEWVVVSRKTINVVN
jgi:hypothetical protein